MSPVCHAPPTGSSLKAGSVSLFMHSTRPSALNSVWCSMCSIYTWGKNKDLKDLPNCTFLMQNSNFAHMIAIDSHKNTMKWLHLEYMFRKHPRIISQAHSSYNIKSVFTDCNNCWKTPMFSRCHQYNTFARLSSMCFVHSMFQM